MRAVFIDRDGTMGGGHTVEYPWEYAPYPGTAEAFRALKEHGFAPMVVTNQSCIARGKSGSYDFAAEFARIGAVDWFICPHDTADRCACRKPGTGLLEQARTKYRLSMDQCYMIGDRWSDMVAGGRVGCRLILVMTGRGRESLGTARGQWRDYRPVYIAQDLKDAADWLCTAGHG